MAKTIDFTGRPIHFIGIGGIGMSALAYILASKNLPVSGSDIRSTNITQKLAKAGATIFESQEASNLDHFSPDNTNNSPQIICSTAINQNNPELAAALAKGYPIFHRSDVLAALIKENHSIAVAGTHGKTTTSSMIGYMLVESELDPTIIIGGEVNAWQGNARTGSSPYLVAEADESDGSLIKHKPKIGVITNIELDHPDHYTSLEQVIKIFSDFAHQCETVIGCIDCDNVRTQIKPDITYSLNPETKADYTVSNVNYNASGTSAQVWEKGQLLGTLTLQVLGEHNLSNALASIAVGRLLNVDFNTLAKGLSTFSGAKRRFEVRGEVNNITFIDDYAHHPSEILVTLAAARLQVQSPRRLVAIFQPHRYSRTLEFLSEFAVAFRDADVVIITDIYSAGEKDLGKVSGSTLTEQIRQHQEQVYYQPSLKDVQQFLQENLQPGDMAIFLGAGNLNQIIPEVIAFYQK